MYYFEQLLYEAAPQIPSPKPVSYVQPKQQQAIKAQASQQQVQAPVQQAPVQQAPVQQVQSQQAQAPQDYSEEDLASFENEEGTEDESAEDDNAAGLVPIKRYFLIQRLFTLNDKLNQLRIKNDVLNLVITFIDSFSYASLLSLSNKLVEDIYLQVKGSTEGATNAQ
jgi:hypothetical protein